jgi:hypothetical protein
MFRDAHPLEVALFWSLTGLLFSIYCFVKIVPRGSLNNIPDYSMFSENFDLTGLYIEEDRVNRGDSWKHPHDTAN